jgi:L-rhamnose mutarotase
MKKVAFKMKLFPGKKDEYIRRHEEIWPELMQLLKDNGISDYSIYLDEETNILFAVQMVDESAMSSQDLGQNPIVQKWWEQNVDIMETNPDNSPVSIPLTEVFHMD